VFVFGKISHVIAKKGNLFLCEAKSVRGTCYLKVTQKTPSQRNDTGLTGLIYNHPTEKTSRIRPSTHHPTLIWHTEGAWQWLGLYEKTRRVQEACIYGRRKIRRFLGALWGYTRGIYLNLHCSYSPMVAKHPCEKSVIHVQKSVV